MRAAILILPFVVLPLAACEPDQSNDKPVRTAIVEPVRLTSGTQAASYSGAIHARHETVLSFRVPGKVVERMVGMGDRVQSGQVLARLDPTDFKLAVKAAQANLKAARQQYQFAQSQFERAAAMRERNLSSQATYDQRKTALEVAKAKLEQAQKHYAQQKNRLGYTKLRAEHAGVITGVRAEPGQVLAAGQPIFGFARAGERELWVTLPQRRIDAVATGDRVEISFWALPDVRVPGRVRKVAADADPRTGMYPVRITLLEQPQGLHLGLSATAHFRDPSADQVIRLPLTSLYHKGGKPAVWVVDASTGKVSLQPVTVRQYKNNAVVLAAHQGLQAGALVVTKGVGKLQPGQRVKPVDAFLDKAMAGEGAG